MLSSLVWRGKILIKTQDKNIKKSKKKILNYLDK